MFGLKKKPKLVHVPDSWDDPIGLHAGRNLLIMVTIAKPEKPSEVYCKPYIRGYRLDEGGAIRFDVFTDKREEAMVVRIEDWLQVHALITAMLGIAIEYKGEKALYCRGIQIFPTDAVYNFVPNSQMLPKQEQATTEEKPTKEAEKSEKPQVDKKEDTKKSA